MRARFVSIFLLVVALLVSGGFLAVTAKAASDEAFASARGEMIRRIKQITNAVGPIDGRDTIAANVLEAMARIPRHHFVPESVRHYAYKDRPLPIGFGQTISQPYIVALMTDLLDLDIADSVLEIGTGSGYQAAVLSEIVHSVATIEIVPQLALQAAHRMRTLGFDNVATRQGDGYYGWPEKAPFDAIIVTAAANHVPPPLVKQLKRGGRMIIPVGTRFAIQHLILVEKADDGSLTARQLLPVRFVPLTGGP